ncbi:unnamed protein product [Effrenium voratum]|nr:unnamed protein product [Effrenium voratum]
MQRSADAKNELFASLRRQAELRCRVALAESEASEAKTAKLQQEVQNLRAQLQQQAAEALAAAGKMSHTQRECLADFREAQDARFASHSKMPEGTKQPRDWQKVEQLEEAAWTARRAVAQRAAAVEALRSRAAELKLRAEGFREMRAEELSRTELPKSKVDLTRVFQEEQQISCGLRAELCRSETTWRRLQAALRSLGPRLWEDRRWGLEVPGLIAELEQLHAAQAREAMEGDGSDANLLLYSQAIRRSLMQLELREAQHERDARVLSEPLDSQTSPEPLPDPGPLPDAEPADALPEVSELLPLLREVRLQRERLEQKSDYTTKLARLLVTARQARGRPCRLEVEAAPIPARFEPAPYTISDADVDLAKQKAVQLCQGIEGVEGIDWKEAEAAALLGCADAQRAAACAEEERAKEALCKLPEVEERLSEAQTRCKELESAFSQVSFGHELPEAAVWDSEFQLHEQISELRAQAARQLLARARSAAKAPEGADAALVAACCGRAAMADAEREQVALMRDEYVQEVSKLQRLTAHLQQQAQSMRQLSGLKDGISDELAALDAASLEIEAKLESKKQECARNAALKDECKRRQELLDSRLANTNADLEKMKAETTALEEKAQDFVCVAGSGLLAAADNVSTTSNLTVVNGSSEMSQVSEIEADIANTSRAVDSSRQAVSPQVAAETDSDLVELPDNRTQNVTARWKSVLRGADQPAHPVFWLLFWVCCCSFCCYSAAHREDVRIMAQRRDQRSKIADIAESEMVTRSDHTAVGVANSFDGLLSGRSSYIPPQL